MTEAVKLEPKTIEYHAVHAIEVTNDRSNVFEGEAFTVRMEIIAHRCVLVLFLKPEQAQLLREGHTALAIADIRNLGNFHTRVGFNKELGQLELIPSEVARGKWPIYRFVVADCGCDVREAIAEVMPPVAKAEEHAE